MIYSWSWGQFNRQDNWKLLVVKIVLLYLIYTCQNQNQAAELKFSNIYINYLTRTTIKMKMFPLNWSNFRFGRKLKKTHHMNIHSHSPFLSSCLGWKWWLKVFRTKIFMWSLRRLFMPSRRPGYFLLNVFPSRSQVPRRFSKCSQIASHFIPLIWGVLAEVQNKEGQFHE